MFGPILDIRSNISERLTLAKMSFDLHYIPPNGVIKAFGIEEKNSHNSGDISLILFPKLGGKTYPPKKETFETLPPCILFIP